MSGPGYVFQNSGMTPPPEDQLEKPLPTLPTEIANANRTTEYNQIAEEEFHQQAFDQNGRTVPHSKLPESIAHLDPTPGLHERAAAFVEDLSPDSHRIAQKTTAVKGAVQIDAPNSFVRDIGWHKATAEIPDPLIGELPNGELFSLIRRFNKVSEESARSVNMETDHLV